MNTIEQVNRYFGESTHQLMCRYTHARFPTPDIREAPVPGVSVTIRAWEGRIEIDDFTIPSIPSIPGISCNPEFGKTRLFTRLRSSGSGLTILGPIRGDMRHWGSGSRPDPTFDLEFFIDGIMMNLITSKVYSGSVECTPLIEVSGSPITVPSATYYDVYDPFSHLVGGVAPPTRVSEESRFWTETASVNVLLVGRGFLDISTIITVDIVVIDGIARMAISPREVYDAATGTVGDYGDARAVEELYLTMPFSGIGSVSAHGYRMIGSGYVNGNVVHIIISDGLDENEYITDSIMITMEVPGWGQYIQSTESMKRVVSSQFPYAHEGFSYTQNQHTVYDISDNIKIYYMTPTDLAVTSGASTVNGFSGIINAGFDPNTHRIISGEFVAQCSIGGQIIYSYLFPVEESDAFDPGPTGRIRLMTSVVHDITNRYRHEQFSPVFGSNYIGPTTGSSSAEYLTFRNAAISNIFMTGYMIIGSR